MKRKISTVMALALSAAMLAGCTQGGDVQGTKPAEGTEKATQEATKDPGEKTSEKEKGSEQATEQPTEEQPSESATPVAPDMEEIAKKTEEAVLKNGYTQVWEDDFTGGISEDDWNYELHEPGWVNNELQEYVKSEDNVFVKDGVLVIKPVKDGDSYTSGRVNTQGKHDFTYGYFEASIKMPAGKGFLPAFWMMASDENNYGQWPRCGEIDIAEVLGNDTKKTYGTVHYGNPHAESQGTYTLTDQDFSTDFHVYGVEWLPGQLNWYVDGNLIHSENEWYSTTVGQGTVTYPAPFDQPFYMILNLAVGGNWPGNPDDTTDFENATMEIDYVRVYQKAEYDENVEAPTKEVTLREADATGNYIPNGDFAAAEDLTDDVDWKFLTAVEGEGSAEIKDGMITIKTDKCGTEDYSIQLVSWKTPMEKGADYKITFDAWADEERQMKVAVTAPERSWIRYFNDTPLDLTTEKKTYTYEFSMKDDTDPEGRLEFNMGNQGSTSTIYITNVRVEKTSQSEAGADLKTVLADGNYVYNGSFREGKDRVGEWSFEGDAEYSVTSLADGRRLFIDAKDSFTVSQEGLAIPTGSEMELSFELESDTDGKVKVVVNDVEETFDVTAASGKSAAYKKVFTCKSDKNAGIRITFPAGKYYLDNVRVVENAMIKNGSFDAGLTGYEIYVDSSASADFVVDALSEDNAVDFTVKKTGDQDWKIQLKQNEILLEKGKSYTLTFDAKCDKEREIRAIMQGGESLGWPVYSGENIVALKSDYQTFTTTFTMEAETDEHAFLSICMGAVSENVIEDQHRICIDNISLVPAE
ncbi:MAG: family 16 glycosylhydrolase [Lachnospiraceae bacterium]|nr:family 16 glycosylhydrolase [Lachnospiraceae bacterium]